MELRVLGPMSEEDVKHVSEGVDVIGVHLQEGAQLHKHVCHPCVLVPGGGWVEENGGGEWCERMGEEGWWGRTGG